MKIAVSSGRLDPVHVGHIAMIKHILKKYDELVFVVLENKTRKFPVCYSLFILNEEFGNEPRVKFVVNNTHFGKITLKELQSYGASVYVGGNLEVLAYIEKLPFPCEYIDRFYQFSARDIPLPH